MAKLIYDCETIDKWEDGIKKGIDKAILAAAFNIRDKIRDKFISDGSKYKYHTDQYNHLANGINVGKMINNQVKIHAMGSKEDYTTWKTRFFVGGTIYRKGNATKSGKSYMKGRIAGNNQVESVVSNSQHILDKYIKNVLNG